MSQARALERIVHFDVAHDDTLQDGSSLFAPEFPPAARGARESATLA